MRNERRTLGFQQYRRDGSLVKKAFSTCPQAQVGEGISQATPEVWKVPGAEADTLKRLYQQEIDRLLNEIASQLQQMPTEGARPPKVKRAEEHVRVLKASYVSEHLPTPALDVLLQYLLVLTQLLRSPSAQVNHL